MKSYNYLLLFVVLVLQTTINPSFAQELTASDNLLDINEPKSSCDLVVPQDSAYGFIRVLEKTNSKVDILQVNVDIEFQISDHEPCYVEKTSPTELYFPKAPLSFKVTRQEGQNTFNFSVHRHRIGPILFMNGMEQICIEYDEEWKQYTWC